MAASAETVWGILLDFERWSEWEITELVPDHRFRWHGHIDSDRLFSGKREFEIDPEPDGTVLVTHIETVTGLLFPVFRAVMGSAIQEHHDNLNTALKNRAEKA